MTGRGEEPPTLRGIVAVGLRALHCRKDATTTTTTAAAAVAVTTMSDSHVRDIDDDNLITGLADDGASFDPGQPADPTRSDARRTN